MRVRRLVTPLVAAGVVVVMLPGVASAEPGLDQTQVSNMGYCSAQLAGTPGMLGLAPNGRAEVNQILRLYGDTFGIPNPGALYSVRARMTVAEDGVCQQRR